MKASVYIETFGCQMNVADTELAATRLRASGYELAEHAETADVVLFNTCSVRARAEQKVFNRIGETLHNKPSKNQIVGVMGCVAQLEGESVFDSARAVRIVVGTRATNRLPAIIERVLGGEHRVVDVGERDDGDAWDVSPHQRRSPYVAFTPIIEGCNKFCTYCIVPYSRGRERSRPANEIVAEVYRLREEGFQEVHLIGQNVNSYRPKSGAGLERFSGATPFVKLLRAVAATGMPRIKFTTSFPRDFHSDIVAAIDDCENLCDWVHLPVQSGSDRILRAMRRGYSVSDYMGRINAIRNASRKISLSTDIIVGFPGETSDDFESTLRLVENCRYDSIYIFKYSKRKGTPAFNLAESVAEEVVTARFQALEDLQKKIQDSIQQGYIGRTVSVLIEGVSARSSEDLFGHSSCNKVVNVRGGEKSLRGTIIPVEITDAKAHSLYGVAV